MAFKALLNAKAQPFPSLCSSFLYTYCSKKLPERAPTKKQLRVLSIIDQLHAWAHRRSAYAQLSPLYPSLYPYVTHVIYYSRPSPASLVPRPHPAHARKRGLVSQVSRNAWASSRNTKRPMKSQSGVYWNNAEARTSTSIALLKVML